MTWYHQIIFFDEMGLVTKTNKSELCTELEEVLNGEDYTSLTDWIHVSTSWVTDVMANLHKRHENCFIENIW